MTNILIYLLFYCAYRVCCRTKSGDAGKVNKASWYSQSLSHFLNNVFNKENPILTDLPDLSQGSAEVSKVSYILYIILILWNSTVLQNTGRRMITNCFLKTKHFKKHSIAYL